MCENNYTIFFISKINGTKSYHLQKIFKEIYYEKIILIYCFFHRCVEIIVKYSTLFWNVSKKVWIDIEKLLLFVLRLSRQRIETNRRLLKQAYFQYFQISVPDLNKKWVPARVLNWLLNILLFSNVSKKCKLIVIKISWQRRRDQSQKW